MRWVLAVGGAALAAILVAFLAVDRDSPSLAIGPEGGTVASNGVSVEFPPGAVASETDVLIAPVEIDAARAYPDLESRSKVYSIEVGEPLQKPVALTLPAPRIRNGDKVLVATREAAGEAWLLLPARAGEGTVQVTIAHLSSWQAVKDTARQAAQKVTEAATNAVAAFLRLGGVRADEPGCSALPPALRLEGDIGTGDPNALIFACLEAHDDGVRLHIVNNRAVGMETQLSPGLRLTDTDSPQVSDAVLDALRSVSGRSWVTIPSIGSITVRAPARDFSLEIHPTLRSFILDLAIFAVGQIGGKEGKAVESSSEFLRCTADAADAVGDGPPRNAAEAVARAQSIARGCIGTLAATAGTGTRFGHAAKYLAVFYGGMKVGTGLTDAVAQMIQGQSAVVSVARAPAADCGTTQVAIGSASELIRGLRANVPCREAEALASEILGRDDCVEETPGGLQGCEAQGYTCEIPLEVGPAGVHGTVECNQGAAHVEFKYGAAQFERGAPFALQFGADGRPRRIGPFDIAAGDSTTGDAIDAFGRSDTTFPTSFLGCTLVWQRLGLTGTFVNYGQYRIDECSGDGGYLNTFVIRSPRFRTEAGLAVGDSEDELRTKHPKATTRGLPGPPVFASEEFPSGSLYSVYLVRSPIAGGLYASLQALVQGGRVTGLEVAAFLGGD